jgi:hypothetical protein
MDWSAWMRIAIVGAVFVAVVVFLLRRNIFPKPIEQPDNYNAALGTESRRAGPSAEESGPSAGSD